MGKKWGQWATLLTRMNILWSNSLIITDHKGLLLLVSPEKMFHLVQYLDMHFLLFLKVNYWSWRKSHIDYLQVHENIHQLFDIKEQLKGPLYAFKQKVYGPNPSPQSSCISPGCCGVYKLQFTLYNNACVLICIL